MSKTKRLKACVPEFREISEFSVCRYPTLDELWASLTTSTYTEPVTVRFEINDPFVNLTEFDVHVTYVQADYRLMLDPSTASRRNTARYPDFGFEGWVALPEFGPKRMISIVPGFLNTAADSTKVESCSLDLSSPMPRGEYLTFFANIVGHSSGTRYWNH